jgi:hypothetical protein
MAIKYANICHCKTLQNLPKLGFLVWKIFNENMPSGNTVYLVLCTLQRRHPICRPSKCRQNVDKMSTKCRQNVNKMSTKCRQNVNKMSTKCRQNVVKMLTKCQQNVDKMLSKCWQNVVKMLTKCCQNVDKMLSKCRQSDGNVNLIWPLHTATHRYPLRGFKLG